MRRKLAAAALVTGLFVVGACGDDGDGGGGEEEETGKTTAEVCEDVDAAVADMQGQMVAAGEEFQAAADSGDDAAALQAGQDMVSAFEGLAQSMRDSAAEAEDEETASTLTTAADEIDAAIASIDLAEIEQGNLPDTTGADQSLADVESMCASAQ